MPTRATPRSDGFRQPAEWTTHRATWLAWPSHANLWGAQLEPARTSFVELCRALAAADPTTGKHGETLEVLVPDAAAEGLAKAALSGLPVRLSRIPFGDIWLRDTAPIFALGPMGLATVSFAFNGWGGKYVLDDDDRVSARIAERACVPTYRFDFVLEGGSIDTDGEGTMLTTRQCLLNPNRNPGVTASHLDRLLLDALGCERVLWLDEGLENDHTDGHVDTLARFVRPGVVVAMEPSPGDPNRSVLETIARDLSAMRDAANRRLEIVRIPSPGAIVDDDGRVMPASYVNFYIGNRAVVVPTYGSPHDDEAVERIGALFDGRRTVGVPAKCILNGGGAFHCITQQEPLAEATS